MMLVNIALVFARLHDYILKNYVPPMVLGIHDICGYKNVCRRWWPVSQLFKMSQPIRHMSIFCVWNGVRHAKVLTKRNKTDCERIIEQSQSNESTVMFTSDTVLNKFLALDIVITDSIQVGDLIYNAYIYFDDVPPHTVLPLQVFYNDGTDNVYTNYEDHFRV